jgi:transcriptional regulator with XRE-family HTH domain
MQYDGYIIGPVIRSLRTDRKMTVQALSDSTGISISAIKQIEQGGRNLSMRNLYNMMEAFGTDANTILNIRECQHDESIDERLGQLDQQKREYFKRSFLYMLDAERLISL